MMKKALVVFGSLMLCMGCSHGKKFNTAGAKVSKGGFTMEAGWVKDKKTHFDVGMTFTNTGSKPLLIAESDVHCSHGGVEGIVTGIDSSLGVAAGGTNTATLHCKLGTPVKEGSYKIELKKVYANPSGDASTKGSEVASNLSLVLEHEKR